MFDRTHEKNTSGASATTKECLQARLGSVFKVLLRSSGRLACCVLAERQSYRPEARSYADFSLKPF